MSHKSVFMGHHKVLLRYVDRLGETSGMRLGDRISDKHGYRVSVGNSYFNKAETELQGNLGGLLP